MLPENHLSTKHIYLADDDRDDRSLFVEALSTIEHPVVLTEAENGEQLMNILSEPAVRLPEIVFMDLNMPKLSGFECLEAIRKDQGHLKDLNIVIFTTSNSRKNIDTAFELGASFYAVKPNTFDQLRQLIQLVLDTDWSHPLLQSNRKFMLAG